MFLIYRIKMLLSGLAVIERIAEDFFAHAGFFQRAHHRQALIAIAHPKFRDELRSKAIEMGYIPKNR